MRDVALLDDPRSRCACSSDGIVISSGAADFRQREEPGAA
jgi:hypothetical protein